jgi:hypothetical protein
MNALWPLFANPYVARTYTPEAIDRDLTRAIYAIDAEAMTLIWNIAVGKMDLGTREEKRAWGRVAQRAQDALDLLR